MSAARERRGGGDSGRTRRRGRRRVVALLGEAQRAERVLDLLGEDSVSPRRDRRADLDLAPSDQQTKQDAVRLRLDVDDRLLGLDGDQGVACGERRVERPARRPAVASEGPAATSGIRSSSST